jgi:hypothetical protein
MSAKSVGTVVESGAEVFIPLTSSRNPRRMRARRRTARRRLRPMRPASPRRASCKIWSWSRSWMRRARPPGVRPSTVVRPCPLPSSSSARNRPSSARLLDSVFSFHFGFSAALENLLWAQNISRTKRDASGGRFTSRPGGRSGLSRRAYCRRHRLDGGTFARWLNALAGEETARKLTQYQTELHREKRREEREKGLRKRRRGAFGISTDVRNRAVQAFWAMHVEAMNWSGMGVREYAAALSLSPCALRKWRDRLGRRRG